MGFFDDMLNGGIDRNFDGKIDGTDRDIMFEEESIAQNNQGGSYGYGYSDDDDSCNSSTYSSASSNQSKKNRYSLFATTYSGEKPLKNEKVVIEWKNMPKDYEIKARRAYNVYQFCLHLFLLVVAIVLLIPLLFYKYIEDFSPLISYGLIGGFIAFILTAFTVDKSNKLTKPYTHIEDKYGQIKYISEYESKKMNAKKKHK